MAQQLAEKMDYIITKISHELYDIYNEINGQRYRINQSPKGYECSCPHWLFRLHKTHAQCKHIKLLRERGAWNE